MFQPNKVIKNLAFVFGVIAISLGLSYAVLAWTEPSFDPPGGNTDTPLNVGDIGQVKRVGLGLNYGDDGITGGSENGLIVHQGNVGIGTADPQTKLEVAGPIKFGDTALACDNATNRGVIKFVQGGAGVADRVYYCIKSASDVYSWINMSPRVISFLDDYTYRKVIMIDNTASSNALSDYQVKVTVDTATLVSAGKMLPSGDDIRFTKSNGVGNLDYWIEAGMNTAATTIWVKVAGTNIIPANGKYTMYMYYGNERAAAASNGMNTFEFFDDFNSYTAITDSAFTSTYNHNWMGGVSSITGGKLYITAKGGFGNQEGWTIKNLSIKDVAIDYYWEHGSYYSSTPFLFRFTDSHQAGISGNSEGHRYGSTQRLFQTGDASQTSAFFPHATLLSVRAYNGDIRVYTDGAYKFGGSGFSSGVPGTIGWMAFSNTDGQSDYKIDNLRIRKYISPEPVIASVSEEEAF